MNDEDRTRELMKEWAFIKDFWQLIKKFYTPDLNPDSPYWNELIGASSALGAKYEGDRLAEKLILGFLDYEEEVRKKGLSGNT